MLNVAFIGRFEPADLPTFTEQSLLETHDSAGSHLLCTSFLPWLMSAIKTMTEREGLGQKVQLLALYRKEVGYPPLLTRSGSY